jgi:hypothetical protein
MGSDRTQTTKFTLSTGAYLEGSQGEGGSRFASSKFYTLHTSMLGDYFGSLEIPGSLITVFTQVILYL